MNTLCAENGSLGGSLYYGITDCGVILGVGNEGAISDPDNPRYNMGVRGDWPQARHMTHSEIDQLKRTIDYKISNSITPPMQGPFFFFHAGIVLLFALLRVIC